MRKLLCVLLAALLLAPPALAATLEVGTGKPFATVQAAVDAAAPGDTLLLAAETFTAGAVVSKPLTIAGASRSSTRLDNGVVKAKGILLVTADGVTVRNLTLENARSPYAANAAGIRAEGRGLTVDRVTFRNNANGILYTAVDRANPAVKAPVGERGKLAVRDSLFTANGSTNGSGQEHGIYASGVDEVEIFRSTFTLTRSGHHVKSRALRTKVTFSTFSDGATSTPASFAIDLPDGGAATIEDNSFTKGTPHWWEKLDGKTYARPAGKTGNECCVIAYGFEMGDGRGIDNPAGPVVVRDNSLRSFVNTYTTATRLFSNRSTPRNEDVTLAGNRLTLNAKLLER